MPLAVLGGLVGTSRKPASRGAMALLLPSPGISITIIERQNCLQSRLQAGRSFLLAWTFKTPYQQADTIPIARCRVLNQVRWMIGVAPFLLRRHAAYALGPMGFSLLSPPATH